MEEEIQCAEFTENIPNSEVSENKMQVHPCLIPHVVDKILGFLPAGSRDLRQARIVCRQWAESASSLLRKQLEVRVGTYCTNLEKFAKLLVLARTSEFIPVSNFIMCQDVFQAEHEHLIKEFFEVFSNVLESLVIWFDIKSTLRFDSQCFINMPISQRLRFPKLKSIGIDDQRRINSDFPETGPRLINWLIQASPNLEELAIQYDRESETTGIEKAGEVHKMLLKLFTENKSELKNLTSLKLDVHFNDALLNCLSIFCQNTRLTDLSLCMRGSTFAPTSFHKFLASLQFSLKQMKLIFLSRQSNFTIQFPKMEQLNFIEISGWDKTSRVHFDNFTYASHLPALKTLLIDSSWKNEPDWWQFLRSKTPVLTIQELKLPEEITKKEIIKEMVQNTFPNLRKLDIKVSLAEVQVLDLIFESCKQLTHLKVQKCSAYWDRSPQIIDDIFTGIPNQICEMLLKCKCMKRQSSFSNDNLRDLRARPGLTNLTKLQRLELGDLQYIAEITDVTGYLCFLSMQSLEYLDVGRSKMSNECMRKLAIRFPENMEQQAKIPRLASKPVDDEPPLDFPGRCNFL